MNHRAQRQSGISRSSRNDDVRATVKSLDNWSSAEVSIGALNSITNSRKRLIRVHIAKLNSAIQQIIDPIENVIARDDADFDFTAEPQLLRHASHRGCAATDIDAAGVRDNFYVALNAGRQNLLHQR